MVTVEPKIINIHGERVELDDDAGSAGLGHCHASTPRGLAQDRIFWMTASPTAVPDPAHPGARHLRHRLSRMIEAFLLADPKHPMIAEINAFFESEAVAIQKGGSEHVFSKEYSTSSGRPTYFGR